MDQARPPIPKARLGHHSKRETPFIALISETWGLIIEVLCRSILFTWLHPQMRPAMRDNVGFRITVVAALLLWQMLACAAEPPQATSPTAVKKLMDKDLIGVPGKDILMATVEYIPGGASLPHRHDAQVFVYLLEGELTMQVEGSPAVKLRPGDTFYENPTDVHSVSANASRTAPAKFLVFIVKDKGAPVTREVTSKATP